MKILQKTQSICPICQRPLEACYISENDEVFLRKTCGEHGEFESYIAGCEKDFTDWTKHPVVNVPPKSAMTKGAEIRNNNDEGLGSQCPLHCGTCENHMQTACCVLIDVTERCNQHCPYCFAKAEADSSQDISIEEIERKYDLLLELGEKIPFNIQLSGGEPTVREDLPKIIKMGRDKGFEFIQINTNGRRLALEEDYAQKLKQAGATVIFLQFDGTDDRIYKALRNEPLFEIKEKAIENCRKAGLPVTLVPTVVKDVNLDNVGAMMEFLFKNIDVVKGIHFQPVSFFGRHPEEKAERNGKTADFENRVTMFDIMHELERQTDGKFKYEDFCPVTTGHTLCCFYGTYKKQKDGSIISLISDETKATGVSCCDASSPLEIIKKDRSFVLNKWDLPSESCCCETESLEKGCSEIESSESCCNNESLGKCCCENESKESCCDEGQELMDFDQFLRDMKTNMFTVSAMAFQDSGNLDAERLKRCRVQVLSDDDRLIPFCAYNSIYRK